MSGTIVLASGSATRRIVLEAAGLAIIVDRPEVDEGEIKDGCRARSLSASDTAVMLAVAKARQVGSRHAGKIVLGADQMLECGSEWFDKPIDRESAKRQIHSLSGRTHFLRSAITAIRDDEVLWGVVESAELTMRSMTSAFIESYLDRVGNRVLSSVGGYQIEGVGIQLFSEIRGDHFTILGLPLLPLLGFLRGQGVIAE